MSDLVTNILVRHAAIEDIPQLNTLLTTLFEQETEFTPNLSAQTLSLDNILKNPSIGCILVSCETQTTEQRIVGMVNLLFTVSTALGGRVALLEDMIIDADYQQQGIGSKLIQAAIEEAKHQNCLRMTLLTDEDNLSAQAFYQKHGFQASSMQPYRLLLN